MRDLGKHTVPGKWSTYMTALGEPSDVNVNEEFWPLPKLQPASPGASQEGPASIVLCPSGEATW